MSFFLTLFLSITDPTSPSRAQAWNFIRKKPLFSYLLSFLWVFFRAPFLDLLFYFHLLLEVDMLRGGGASPTAIGGFEYGTGGAVQTTAIMLPFHHE